MKNIRYIFVIVVCFMHISGFANTNFTNAPTHILADNINSSTLAQSTYSNTAIMVNGTFTIDNNLTLNNCQMYFTANAKIDILNNYTLNLDGCTLQSGCGTYWDGIYADDITEQLNITNSTNISDMENGINITNNAKIISTGNTYRNNAKYAINLNGIALAAQAPIIDNNNFLCNTAFIPYNTATKGNGGIAVFNCNSMSMQTNTFDNIYNGIKILADANINTIVATQSNTIQIIDNSFNNINDDVANTMPTTVNAMPGLVYTSPAGGGVYINYDQAAGFNAKTIIKNTDTNLTTNPAFNNCDKAIASVNNKLDAINLNITNCYFGIMNTSLPNKHYYMHHSRIVNPHIGIQIIGNTDEFTIDANRIYNATALLQQFGPALYNAPIGIDIKHWVAPTNTTNLQHIRENYIDIGHITGTGIAELNSNVAQNTTDNTITFSTNSTASAVANITKDLTGISFVNSNNTNIGNNYIDGITSTNAAVYTARQTKGIYFQDSKDCNISCNRIKYTKQGFYGWGNNSINNGGKMTYNKMHHIQSPLYTYDGSNTNIGTFGDIGSTSDEAANDWLYNGMGASYLAGGKKILRITENITSPGNIFTGLNNISNTNFLLPGESGVITSTGFGVIYGVSGNSSFYTDPCIPAVGSFLAEPNTDNGTIEYGDISHDLDIVNNNISYINYGTVGHWLDQRDLYNRLDHNVDLRNSDPVLLSFYNTTKLQMIGKIKNADSALLALSININNNNISDLYNFAQNTNDAIENGESWEMNEHFVNDQYINIMQNGLLSIDEEIEANIKNLANTCPYVGGSAVYKARVLYTMLQPNVQYNDRVLCIPQTLNKMADGSNHNPKVDIDSLNEANALNQFGVKDYNMQITSVENKTTIAKENLIIGLNTNNSTIVFPNPSNGAITITYNQLIDGKFELYNSQLQLVETLQLQNGNKRVETELLNVSNGLYTYKLIFGNQVINGKLVIIK